MNSPLDDLIDELFGEKPEPAPSDRAFELADEASRIAARFGNLIEARKESQS